MKHKLLLIFFLYLFCSLPLLPAEQSSVLQDILQSLSLERGMINSRRTLDTALVGQRYSRLQWWQPSLIASNDFVYPYKNSAFDDVATSNTSSLFLSLPLPTGTSIEANAGYSLDRSMTETEQWGFSQSVRGSIGIRQSLNPWWLHTTRNPYTNGARVQTEIAKTEYNISLRNLFFSSLTAYIELRKSERNSVVLAERMRLHNDTLEAYRAMLLDGSVSMRQMQDIRNNKWQDEQALFALEQNIFSLKKDLFQMSGLHIGEVMGEDLIDIDHALLSGVFIELGEASLMRLEETNIALQGSGLHYEDLIFRQNTSPSIKIEFGSSFLLPVQERGSLGQAWEKKYFTDSELSNWAFNVSVDLSSLLSPANKKQSLQRRITEEALAGLADRLSGEREDARNQNNAAIDLLEKHIDWLITIVDNDIQLVKDIAVLYARGSISELEHRKVLIEHKEKYSMLDNLHDELWLRRLLQTFYY